MNEPTIHVGREFKDRHGNKCTYNLSGIPASAGPEQIRAMMRNVKEAFAIMAEEQEQILLEETKPRSAPRPRQLNLDALDAPKSEEHYDKGTGELVGVANIGARLRPAQQDSVPPTEQRIPRLTDLKTGPSDDLKGKLMSAAQLKAVNTSLSEKPFNASMRHELASMILKKPLTSINELDAYDAHVVLEWMKRDGSQKLETLAFIMDARNSDPFGQD
jgi:hypothetical protein